MTWTAPFTAVVGATITAAGHNTSIRDNLLHLRALLPDSGASGRLLQAASTTTAAFVAPAGDSILTPSSVTGNGAGSAIGTGVIHANRMVAGSFDETQVDAAFAAGAIDSDRIKTDSITETQMGASVITGNAGGSAIGTGVIHPNRLVPGAFDATQVNAAFGANSISEPILNCLDSPADNEVLTYDNATGQFEWQALSALSNSVPSGLIAAFATNAAIATGWARFTALDGRVPVGAGTTFTVTFTEATDYGSSWSHTHTMGNHTHTGPSHVHGTSGLSITGTTGNPSGLTSDDENMEHAGAEHVAGTHTHGFAGTSSGNTDAGGTGASGAPSSNTSDATAWTIPMRAVVWAQKS